MVILAFETSAKAASTALLRDGALVAEYFQNSGQTHSRTVMKLAQDMLENCDCTAGDVDAVAYANGPGSFTGVRIGAAAAKGFCWGRDIPCLPVSTLEAMAHNLDAAEGIVCCCMDARRQQVYNALFSVCQGSLTRLTPDRAISLEALGTELAAYDRPVFAVGDGAKLCCQSLGQTLPRLRLTPEQFCQQRASGVALAGWQAAQAGGLVSAAAVAPNYLRLSQAERERLAREQHNEGE